MAEPTALLDTIQDLRARLLDPSRSNPLLSTRIRPRDHSYLRIINDPPDAMFEALRAGRFLPLAALPDWPDTPDDEKTAEFQDALAHARLVDPDYLERMDRVDLCDDGAFETVERVERSLRDWVREQVGLPARPRSAAFLSLPDHARARGIRPSFDLPGHGHEHGDGRRPGSLMQTLLLPDTLGRTVEGLERNLAHWREETGLNVLHAAMGFLEWRAEEAGETFRSPLVLLPVRMAHQRTDQGTIVGIEGTGEDAIANTVLIEVLREQHGIDLPRFRGGSVENYLAMLAMQDKPLASWRIRRHVTVGIFHTAGMALFQDSDPHQDGFARKGLVSRLYGAPDVSPDQVPYSEPADLDIPGIQTDLPLLIDDTDAAQASAVADVARGEDLVLETPPGTAKTKAIVNMAAAALSQGRSVLIVSDKTSALEAVRVRMAALGLGPFVLPFQGERVEPAHFAESVRRRLALTPETSTAVAQVLPEDEDEGDDIDGELEERVAQIEIIRNEIKTYLDILHRPFRDSSYTVQDILARAIQTAERLDEAPAILKDAEKSPLAGFDRSALSRGLEAARVAEQAWTTLRDTDNAWVGLAIGQLDREAAAGLAERARGAAGLFAQSADLRQSLEACGVPLSVPATEVRRLALLFAELRADLSALPDGLLERVLREDLIDALRAFQRREKEREAAANATSDRDPNAASRRSVRAPLLRKVGAVLNAYNIPALRTEMVRERLDSIEGELDRLTTARRAIDVLMEDAPAFGDAPLSDVIRAHALLRETPDRVLDLRSRQLAEPENAALLERLHKMGAYLKDWQVALEDTFRVDEAPSAADLVEHVEALRRGSGPLGLSGTFKAARRAYDALALEPMKDHERAAKRLTKLARWKRETERFLNDEDLNALCGEAFQGIDTDFEIFRQLADFLRRVDDAFPGEACADLRQTLRNGGPFGTGHAAPLPNLAAALPEDLIASTPDDLQRRIEGLERDRAALAEVISVLPDLITHLPDPSARDLGTVPAQADALEAREDQLAMTGENPVLVELFGPTFKGSASDLAMVSALSRAAESLNGFGNQELVRAIIRRNALDKSRVLVTRWLEAFERGNALLADLRRMTGAKLGPDGVETSETRMVDVLREAAGDARHLNSLGAALDELDGLGLRQTASALIESGQGLDGYADLLEGMVFRILSNAVFTQHRDVMEGAHGERLETLLTNLAFLEEDVRRLARQKLARDLKGAAYGEGHDFDGAGHGTGPQWTRSALIQDELDRSDTHRLAADLTHRAGPDLLTLMPCWLMPALAVPLFLPAHGVEFDLCIIDEASRMPAEHALSAIMRCRQMVVVGDHLTPAPSARLMAADTPGSAIDAAHYGTRSVLDVAIPAIATRRRLHWHEGSLDPSLVAFSNRLVYDGSLTVLPAAREDLKGSGVSLVAVPGTCHEGRNFAEARAMVETAIATMRSSPGKSLGLVTVTRSQADVVQGAMTQALKRDPKAAAYVADWKTRRNGLEPFFIRALDQIQDDRRDIIFIGTVFGPEHERGPLPQNFGPLTGENGRRHLAVLATLARRQAVTFSSMTASQIETGAGGAVEGDPAATMLRHWLDYSAVGGSLALAREGGLDAVAPFTAHVMDQIEAMGCEAVPGVGIAGSYIDIGVRHPAWPQGYLMGIEIDGTLRERDLAFMDRFGVRPRLLRELGWTVLRMWSRDWLEDPDREATRIRDAIASRLGDLRRPVSVRLKPLSLRHAPLKALPAPQSDNRGGGNRAGGNRASA